MNEDKAIAILMANLKGAKKKPSNLLEFSEACGVLREKWGFKKMSEFFHVSQYMLRQIDKINELDKNLKNLVKNGDLGIEGSYHLWRLSPNNRTKAAKILSELNSEEIRVFMNIARKNKEKSIEIWKKEFEQIRNEKIQMIILPVEPELYKKLEKNAKKTKSTVHDYALKIIKKNL
jgi:hypothetical protein